MFLMPLFSSYWYTLINVYLSHHIPLYRQNTSKYIKKCCTQTNPSSPRCPHVCSPRFFYLYGIVAYIYPKKWSSFVNQYFNIPSHWSIWVHYSIIIPSQDETAPMQPRHDQRQQSWRSPETWHLRKPNKARPCAERSWGKPWKTLR